MDDQENSVGKIQKPLRFLKKPKRFIQLIHCIWWQMNACTFSNPTYFNKKVANLY